MKIKRIPRNKIDFARLFFDETFSDHSARIWLKKEIESDPELFNKLCEVGYKPKSKQLTVVQQQTIFDYFGINAQMV